jgi:NADH dehydrogenase
MRVAVTGGTGYLGPAVVEEFLASGHDVVVIEHRRPVDVPDHPRLRRVKGDVTDSASLEQAFAGCDAVAHLVAIIREEPEQGATFQRIHVEGTRNVIRAARVAGARRFLLMSANGVEQRNTPYFETKSQMETMVKEAGFTWTIFRPSYIAGARKGGFDEQFASLVDRFPVLPSFRGGKFEIQPVSRRNVAQAFARALVSERAEGKTYVLVGPERMTWNTYLKRLARLRGKRRALVYTPAWAILFAARYLRFLFPVPVSPDQLRMLMAGNVGDPTEAVRDLGLTLEPWETAVEGLRVMRPARAAGRMRRGTQKG